MEQTGTTIRSQLADGRQVLESSGVPNARRNAEWLLMSVLGGTILDLIVESERPLTAQELNRYRELLARRAAREPLQYILGDTSFMSGRFNLEPGVFIPRPDTERLVEVTAGLMSGGESCMILDVCCGSGVIGISLAVMLPGAVITGIDSNPQAVEMSKNNAALNEVEGRARFLTAAAETYEPPEPGCFDAVVCNPPYIPSGELGGLPPEVRDHEPLEALDGGPEGLDFYREVMPRLASWLRAGGLAAFEIGAEQAAAVSGLMQAAGLERIVVHRDYRGLDRVVTGFLPA